MNQWHNAGVTRFTYSILFFFAIALALLCSSVLMLYLHRSWPDASFGVLVGTALAVSLVVPLAAALASLRYVRWQQPLTAWVAGYALLVIISVAFGIRLL